MTREDITRMAREAGFVGFDGDNGSLRRFAALVAAAEREKLAKWMLERSYATGHGDTTEDLLAELDWQVKERIAAEREATHRAYKERNQLVALLSTCFPSGKAKTAIEGWDESWHGCIYIDLPWGQASWHYHDSDAWMFEHLHPYQGKWDGHTTEEKYSKMAKAIRARGQS